MANQYNNKVVLSNGTTIIDLSTDTVTDASHIMSGKVGHLADGSVVTGTGASESQVVSIEDVPNTTGTTAVITGVAAPEGSISITTNGTHDVTAYEEAIVNVPSQTPAIQPLTVTSNGTYTAPSGVDGYSPVTVNVSGGGGEWSPIGQNPVKIATLESARLSFADIGFGSWSYKSSSYETIKDGESYQETTQCDLSLYDYVQVVKMYGNFAYNDPNQVKAVTRTAYCCMCPIVGTYTTEEAVASTTPDQTMSPSTMYVQSPTYEHYRTSSGKIAFNYGTSVTSTYGLFPSVVSPAYDSLTTATPTITWNRPKFVAKGDSNKYSSAAHTNVRLNDSYYYVLCEIWRSDKDTSAVTRTAVNMEAMNIFNNGIVEEE